MGGFAQLAAATVAGQVIGFAALAYVSREIGPSFLGAYTFVAALVVWFTVPSNFGMTLLGTRDVALQPERRREIAAEVTLIQFALGLLAFAVLILLRPVVAPDDAQSELVPIVGLTIIVAALNLEWALQGAQRFGAMAISRFGGQVVYGVLIALIMTGGLEGAKRYALANAIGLAAAAAISGWAFLRLARLPSRPLAGMRPALADRIRRALPLGFAAMMVQVYYSIDAVMLGYLDTDRAVGLYGAAYRVPMAIIAFALLWVVALFPYAARVFASDPDRLRRQVGEIASYALVIGTAVAVGAALLSAGLMPTLFGDDFADGARPFALLCASAAIVLVNVNFGNVLLACGDERRYAVGVTLGAVLNVVLNIALIPSAGPSGAATATIAAEILVLAYMYRRFVAVVGPAPLSRGVIGRGAIAVALMAAALLATAPLSSLVELAVGLSVFSVAAGALGLGRLRELARRARADAAL